MENYFAEDIVNSKRSAKRFLKAYQVMPLNDIADMYGIDTNNVKIIMKMMVEKYSIRRREVSLNGNETRAVS